MFKILMSILAISSAGSALGDVAFHNHGRFILFSKSDNQLVRTSCPLDTLPLSIGTCRDEHSKIALALVYPIALPQFGGAIGQHSQRARQWAVEIARADEKIVELLGVDTTPNPAAAQLRQDISALSNELSDLDRLAYALDDQIALLEAELARRPDNDILGLLNTRRGEKKVIDENRRQIINEMESLRSRILQAQGGIFDQSTFQRVVRQRTEALAEYTNSLALVTAEEERRIGYEQTLGYIGDTGFTYKLTGASDTLSIEAANALYQAFDEAVAESIELKVLPTQRQLVSCPGGFNSFCGLRARITVPVTSRLKEVSCQIVGAVTPCYRLSIYKADSNELIAVEGSIVQEEKGEVSWDYSSIAARAWDLEAKGNWIVLGRCEHPGPGDISLRYPARLDCSFKLRGP